MLVAKYYNNKDVRVEEMQIPEISENEVLVKVIACGICGSDVMEWYRIKKAPLVLGHEMTGIIVKKGKNVENFEINDRVFVSHHVPCFKCYYCLHDHHTCCETLHKTNFYPGGFSQYVRVPEINLKFGTFLLPENVSFEEGTLIEPLGCVYRAQKLMDLKNKKFESVLIIGSGVSGLLHLKLAKFYKKKVAVADINDYKLNKAKDFGADFTINVNKENLKENLIKNFGKLPDGIIVCTSAESASKSALDLIDSGGTIMFFAVPKPGTNLAIDINDFWKKEITIKTSYAASPDDLKNALELISNKKINVSDMITHVLPISEIQQGFNLVAESKNSIKVVIKPNL